jgi:hypothetical protein
MLQLKIYSVLKCSVNIKKQKQLYLTERYKLIRHFAKKAIAQNVEQPFQRNVFARNFERPLLEPLKGL